MQSRLSKDQLELQLPARQNREIDAIFQSSQLNSVAHWTLSEIHTGTLKNFCLSKGKSGSA